MDEPKGKLDTLGDKLYSPRSPEIIKKPEHLMHGVESDLPTDFAREDNRDDFNQPIHVPTSLFTKIFIASLIFLIGSLGTAFYVYYRGLNVISPNNINITISGPTTIVASDKVELLVNIENKNKSALELGDLVVDYPDGTRDVYDQTHPLVHEVYDVGQVPERSVKGVTIKSSFFGETGTQKQIKLSFQYRIAGSTSIFTKQKVYDITLSAAPVNLTIDTIKEVSANQEFTIKIKAVSNAKNVIKNAFLTVAYPSGFVPKTFSPDPIDEASTGQADDRFDFFAGSAWSLGDMEPGGTREIQITGSLEGQNSEAKLFKVDIGSAASSTSKSIYTKFAGLVQEVAIKQPFIASDILIQDTRGGYVAEAGENLSGKIVWKNTSQTSINNPVFELTFDGNILNEGSINAADGFYQSNKKSIVWNSQTNKELREIAPGQMGTLSFYFALNDPTKVAGADYKNPTLNMTLDITGNRLSEQDVPESIQATAMSAVALKTDIALDANTSFKTGPFKNTGSNPPRVDEATTYTVNLSLSNTFSDAKDVFVTTSLPTYVTWLNEVSQGINGGSEKVTYDRSRNEIRWEVGDLYAGAGNLNSKPPRTVSFKVSILPSVTQKDAAPVLVNQFLVSGSDAYTGAALSAGHGALTTETKGDGEEKNDGQVQ